MFFSLKILMLTTVNRWTPKRLLSDRGYGGLDPVLRTMITKLILNSTVTQKWPTIKFLSALDITVNSQKSSGRLFTLCLFILIKKILNNFYFNKIVFIIIK